MGSSNETAGSLDCCRSLIPSKQQVHMGTRCPYFSVQLGNFQGLSSSGFEAMHLDLLYPGGLGFWCSEGSRCLLLDDTRANQCDPAQEKHQIVPALLSVEMHAFV